MKRQEVKQVGIWVRVSDEDAVNRESPETHEKRGRLYAEAKGWKVVELYRLDAISGKTVKEQPEAKRMLKDVKSGRITGLIFSKLARLARNTKELLEFADIFQEHNADLISLAESIDTSTPAGRFFYTLLGGMAEWERSEIAARVSAAMPIRAQMGKHIGGIAPFGYRYEDKKLVIDPSEAPVRKLMYELFRQYRRNKAVARMLNTQGYRTRKGEEFTDTTVCRLIQDTTAKGIRRAHYTETKGRNQGWKLRSESEWVLTPVEPIVSVELWEECNKILTERRKTRKAPGRLPVHLFAGYTFCECGEKMYARTNEPKYRCEACHNKIPVDTLEQVFHSEIQGFLHSPEEIAAYLETAQEKVAEKVALVSGLETEQRKLQAEIDKLHDLYQSGDIDKAGFGARYHPKAERLRQLGEAIPEAQAEVDVMKIVELSREDLLTEARDLYESWPTLEHGEKRYIVETITDRIIVGKDEVTISLIGLSTIGGDDPDGDGTPPPPHPLNSPQNGNATRMCRQRVS